MVNYRDPNQTISYLRELIENDKISEARNLALRSYYEDFRNIEYHIKFGEVFEELGFADKAEKCYVNALKLDNNNIRALTNLAELLYEVGRLDYSMNLFRKILKIFPESKEAKTYLVNIYRELGLKGSEQVVSGKKEKTILRYFPPSLGKSELEVFESLFTSHVPNYFEVKLNKTGKPVLIYVPKRPDHKTIRAHILGEKTISCALLSEDNKVKTATLEVKVPKRDVVSLARNKSLLEMKKEKLKETSLDALKRIRDLALPVYLERASQYRYRLWFFFEEPIHLLFSKRFLKKILKKMPVPEMGILLEASLPTKSSYVGWKENPKILPLGLNPATRERCLFVGEKGTPYPDQIAFIKKIRKLSLNAVKSFLKKDAHFIYVKKEKSLTLTVLKRKCEVLKVILSKAESGRSLTRNEKVVVYFTLGILDPSGDLVHEALFPCPDYRYEKVKRELKNLRPNPISCFKVRELVPDIAGSVNCSCTFNTSDGRYPSPVMHVNRLLVPKEEERLSVKHLGVKGLLKKYINLVMELRSVRDKISIVEEELEKLFRKKNWFDCEIEGFRIIYSPEESKFKVEKV